MRSLTRRRRRGTTLVEVVVAAVLATAVLGGLALALRAGQSLSRSQPQILDVQRNLRAAAQLLASELRGVDAAEGDLIAMSDTAATFLAGRGVGVVCAAPDTVGGRVILGTTRYAGLRAIDPSRDSVLLFRDGDTLQEADDRWLRARVAAAGTGTCADGSAGTRLTLAPPGGAPDLSGVRPGAPLFAVEAVRYRSYEDATHVWWLGVQSFSGGWSVTSPVAGPLRPRDGLRFSYLDSDGGPAAARTAVRSVTFVLRGRSVRPMALAGRRSGPFEDSVTVRVGLRNGAAH